VTLIDINTATQTELESLPGIGPAYAAAIITYRTRQPFRRIEDVLAVRGIGEKRLEDIRDLITVR
jgi:competence protein ComEA